MRRRARESLTFAGLGIFGALLATAPGRAHADGAFPDAQNILTPADRPGEIVMATNFGVVFSEDGGLTWLWTCEQTTNAYGYLYQMGLPPRHRVYALANKLLVYTDDLTCGWRISGGGVTGQDMSDVWVDRAVPDRLMAIGVRSVNNANVYSVFESTDGGGIFGAALYVTAPGDSITGIETANSDPRTIYMTMLVGPTYTPILARSSDGGANWRFNDLSVSLGPGNARLIAVDAQNANKVFLLWNDPVAGQALATTEDGGVTATIRLPATGDGTVIRAFTRTATGALLIATDLNGGALHRSRDGGVTFEAVANPPRIRGFSVRGATIYAATDNFSDGYALGASSDDGTTWTPMMSYSDVRAIAGCLKDVCQDMCALQVPMLWSADVCAADAPSPVPDGGTGLPDAGSGSRDAGADGAAGGRAGAGGTGGTGNPRSGGGGCAVARGAGPDAWPSLLAAVLACLIFARRRRC